MAISVNFNGATIYRPGAYSKTTIDVGGGLPIGPAGLIAVIGEADAGEPGAELTNLADNNYTGDQLSVIRQEYRSGPIADAAAFLFAPASDAAIPSGAQTIWIYKTNASVRATLALASSYGTVRAREWGVGGNRITFASTLVAETAPAPKASSAAFDETSILINSTFTLHMNGGQANVFTFPSAPTNNANLASLLANAANWSNGLPVGMTIAVGGVDGASTVSFTMAAAPTQYTLGWGRSFELVNGTSTPLTVMNITPGLVVASVEPSATLVLDNRRDNIQESDIVGGNVVLVMGHDGSGGVNTATVTIDADSIILNQNGSPVHTLPKSSYATLKQLVDDLNLVTYGGWSAEVTNPIYNQLSLDMLDQVTAVGARSPAGKPARIKKDAAEVADFFAEASIASIESQAEVGLPAATTESLLAGGAKGGTSTGSVITALEKFEKFHVNFVVPLFSRDAADDIADGLTDASSTYTIAGIHQAVKTHLSLMKTVKKRSERQAMLSIKDTYEACKEQAGVMADARIQMLIQDIRQVDAQGNIKWFQPWALAALMAGARSGAPIGEPLTNKFLNLSGIRQTAQSMSTPDADIVIDFDPDLQADDAIIAGITFLEAPTTGGFRVVVDNTTYGIDNNFVFNRGNVLYAADISAKTLRDALEARFVGRKNTISVADVAAFVSSVLTTLKNQGVLVATPDAPQGYKGLAVRIEGNTIYVDVIIKIVEGIDFVLSDITIQRAIS